MGSMCRRNELHIKYIRYHFGNVNMLCKPILVKNSTENPYHETRCGEDILLHAFGIKSSWMKWITNYKKFLGYFLSNKQNSIKFVSPPGATYWNRGRKDEIAEKISIAEVWISHSPFWYTVNKMGLTKAKEKLFEW